MIPTAEKLRFACKAFANLLLLVFFIASASPQASVIWQFDLGPDIPSPGPNSIQDGSITIEVATDPRLVIDRASDWGFYVTQRAVIDAQLFLDGTEWNVIGGTIGQYQCWDHTLFPDGCNVDTDQFGLLLYLDTGGYLEISHFSSPESSFPSIQAAYPFWTLKPMTELTEPISTITSSNVIAQGIRDPSAPNRGAFQFNVESWRVVPEPSSLSLLLTGGGLVGIFGRRRLRADIRKDLPQLGIGKFKPRL